MSKPDRISQQIDRLEAEYRLKLVAALSECAEGRWGLFGQNEHLGHPWCAAHLDELRDLADTINSLRSRLGEPAYPLHVAFEASRGRGGSNQLGEPKLAKLWLERLQAG